MSSCLLAIPPVLPPYPSPDPKTLICFVSVEIILYF